MMESYSERLIDYLDGKLSLEDKVALEKELDDSVALRTELEELRSTFKILEQDDIEYAPSDQLHSNFDKFLKEQIDIQKHDRAKTLKDASQNRGGFKLVKLYKYAAAAVVLLLIGVMTGRMVMQEEQLDYMSEELYTLLEQKSTSQRIKAVNLSQQMADPNDGILDALINTMNTDKSSNVRLAAVSALEKFATETKVVDAFINSLSLQEDPTVTITLINILATIKEQNAIQPLEQILEDDKHMQFVKDEAQVGIFKLTSI